MRPLIKTLKPTLHVVESQRFLEKLLTTLRANALMCSAGTFIFTSEESRNPVSMGAHCALLSWSRRPFWSIRIYNLGLEIYRIVDIINFGFIQQPFIYLACACKILLGLQVIISLCSVYCVSIWESAGLFSLDKEWGSNRTFGVCVEETFNLVGTFNTCAP